MPNGYRKVIKDGKSVYLEIDDNRQEVGTTVICHEIYRKQPVRRKYLLTRSKKVLNLIKRCVLHVALVQPWVAFKVVDIGSENELLSIHPSRSPLPLVTAYFGSDVSSTLNMVDFSKGELKLLGYLSSPNLGFSTKDWASIRSFTEAALRHFWGQSTEHLLQGESSVHKDDTSLSKANLEENNGVMNTSEACCRRKCLEQKYFPPEVVKQVTLSTGHPYIRKCTDEQHYTNMNKRKLYLGNCSFTEAIEGTLPTKWRNGEPESEEDLVNDVMMIENKHSASSDCLDGVLNISSGLLYLSGSCLVPESISKDYLEAAKVLQQLDRKFIPITAGGVLAVVDQHAADERIRLEELHQNVLSGKGKSISYLEYGKELVLPEFGFQLLQNYTDQIRRWGWICDIHAENMCSFTRNLNILHQQAVKVTLIAVPCILGINLSDKDLLEFLDQLVDTDGSSSIPPAVLRILNYKACRGAIMFGDTLLPSECSLIVDELKRTSLCFQCAHGRPTTVPLVNLEALHEQLNRLNSSGSGATESWHGLRRYEPSLERAKARLAAARNCG